MELDQWVIQERGRQAALAGALGVKPPVVADWRTGKKSVPVPRCAAIERLTGGAVTRQELRPNDWSDIWPELAQRQGATT